MTVSRLQNALLRQQSAIAFNSRIECQSLGGLARWNFSTDSTQAGPSEQGHGGKQAGRVPAGNREGSASPQLQRKSWGQGSGEPRRPSQQAMSGQQRWPGKNSDRRTPAKGVQGPYSSDVFSALAATVPKNWSTKKIPESVQVRFACTGPLTAQRPLPSAQSELI